MKPPFIVIDTNVLVAGLRSRRGKSFELLTLVGKGKFGIVLSVPLLMEYEDVLMRQGLVPATPQAIGQVLDYLCAVGLHQRIFYLWRPKLKDPKDDMVLELAFNAGAGIVVTHNVKDYQAAQELGIKVMTPGVFLELMEEETP